MSSSYLLKSLQSKKEVDKAIRGCEDKVLVLRFGRETDPVCLQLDDIVSKIQLANQVLTIIPRCDYCLCSLLQLSKNEQLVSQMAEVYAVDADSVPVYIQYFDISLLPATVFFFNGQHMKVDWGSVVLCLGVSCSLFGGQLLFVWGQLFSA